MSDLVLKFTEEKTHYGVVLHGVLSSRVSITIAQHKGGAIDYRKQCEGYIVSQLTNKFIRLRGEHKLMEARNKLYRLGGHKGVVELLDELLHELRNPQFNIVGAKQ